MTGRDVALAVGTSEAQVSRWRNGLRPGPNYRKKLIRKLKLTVEEIELLGWPTPDAHQAVLDDRERTRKKFRAAVQAGELERAPACEKCGAECVTHGHHFDYSKPLDVEWLCRDCHMAVHAELRREEAVRV